MNDFDRVKEAVSLKEYAEANLDRVRDGLVCPNCKSGTGKNKTAAFSVKGEKMKCFACDAGGDVFDLAGLIHDTTDKRDQLRLVADWAGVTLENDRDGTGSGFRSSWGARSESETATKARKEEKYTDTPENDYTAGRERHRRYIAECAERMREEPTEEVISYLSARGITHAEAVTLGIGYDPKPAHGWKDEAGAWHNTPRIILPWAGCDYYHIDRAIDERAHDLKYDKPPSDPNEEKGITADMCVGAQPLYNPEAFTQDYVIAVEGVLDAIAVQLCGFNAIALGGTAVNDFANEAATRKYGGVVIDMLDADGEEPKDGARGTKGRGAGADLVTLLGKAGVTVLNRAEYGVPEGARYGQVGTVSNGYKDAGEWYAAEPQYLKDFMGYAVKAARDKAQHEKEIAYREAMKSLKVQDPAKIAQDIFDCANEEIPTSTGFESLDALTHGGHRAGLNVFGAVSSAGKTTFLIQLADYAAAHGRPVLFVSIEQSGRELVAKSLSRMMAQRCYEGTTLYEMGSSEHRPFDVEKEKVFKTVLDHYKENIAPNLVIMSAEKEQPNVNNIWEIAATMAQNRGQSPIIMLDYLQLLGALNERYTDKQNADQNVSQLRRMAKELQAPVWVISSLNRDSYSKPIGMSSFKESGGIEYGSDLLLGLQPYEYEQDINELDDKGRFPSEALRAVRAKIIMKDFKTAAVKKSEIVVLKNRNGRLPDDPLPFTFCAAHSYFTEGVRTTRKRKQ